MTSTETGPAIELDTGDDDFDFGDELAGVVDDQVDDVDDSGDPFADLPPGDHLILTLLDGEQYALRITMRELVAYDSVQAKKGWGPMSAAPHRAQAFMAWSAGRRDQLPAHDVPFDKWVNTVDDIAARKVARPTR